MSLYQELQNAKTEEDVKDAYIKALGLKGYSKNLIDIQTKEVWFEAKLSGKESIYEMYTQLLHYVQVALNKGEYIPPFLAVIDPKKAAIMRSADVIPFLAKKTINWGTSASRFTQEALESVSTFLEVQAHYASNKPSQEAIDEVSTYIGTHFVSFKIATHQKEFIETVKTAIKSGEIIRTQITPDNLKQVFDKWVDMIGREIDGVSEDDYALLFYADIMHDGTVATHKNLTAELLHKDGAPVFRLNGCLYELGNKEGYRQFWAIYHKPPKEEFRNYLLERRDSLIPLDKRSFQGAFYTPLPVVDKAYDLLVATFGADWQKNYIVWDMCCGVGNLEVKHGNPRNVFMSTLDQADVDVMKATRTCVAAQRFQYDYLNDDITDDGEIDYSLTGKIPKALQDAIKNGKKILVLINPPYAEAANRDNTTVGLSSKDLKTGVAKTRVAAKLMSDYGSASNELYIQFLARIAKEMPNSTLAMFSTMKYVNAPTLDKFRSKWNAQFLDGFVIHSKAFDGIDGDFPIGFMVWQTNQKAKVKTPITEVMVSVYDRDVKPIGAKTFYNPPKSLCLNTWIERPKPNSDPTLPLKNAVSPATTKPRNIPWADGAIAYMVCGGNDLQHAEQQTVIYSSVYQNGHGFHITPENLQEAAVMFAVRRLVRPTWLNDRDQFLQPTKTLPDEFKSDCLIWMLFNRCNRTASADGIPWGGKKWSLVNHFIPFTEDEVGASDRFESDFMVEYMKGMVLSVEAKAVLDQGRALWQIFHADVDVRATREELFLNRADVGWFQIRKALEKRKADSGTAKITFDSFLKARDLLTDKLVPQVYNLGFMR